MKRREILPAIVGAMGLLAVTGCALLCPRLDEIQKEPTEAATLFPEEWLEPVIIIEERESMRGPVAVSGMPCETWEVRYEQETSEEVTEDRVLEETAESDGYRVAGEGSVEAASDDVPEQVAEPATVETVQEPAISDAVEETLEVHVVVPAEETRLEDVLMHELEALGIGYFYPYAWAQAMQESHWDPNAVNANGLDFGLLQYRLKSPDGTRIYWTGPGDIMDPYAQIQKYVGQVKARLDAGLSIEETISRHYTSDWVTDINWDYVNLVLSHIK